MAISGLRLAVPARPSLPSPALGRRCGWRLVVQPATPRRSQRRPLRAPAPSAAAGGGGGRGRPPRLLPFVLSAPRRVESYFERSLARRALWCVISFGAGFFCGNVVALSFGALAVNDILAAMVTLLFYEVVTTLFYRAERKTLRLWFAQFFKNGVVAAMLADALKLGG